MKRGVSIVIPSWNGLALLDRFLPSVLAAARVYVDKFAAPVEVLIVDDGSTDETVRRLLERGFIRTIASGSGKPGNQAENLAVTAEKSLEADLPPTIELKLVVNEINSGFGEASNRGVRAASHALVLLLNNDVDIDRDAISPLVDNFRDPTVFAAHCRVFDLDSGVECGTGKLGGFSRGFFRVHGSYSTPSSPAPGPLFSMFAGGGSAMFDKQKFIDLGGFEPLLSPFYWEDVELSYRAWKRGFTILYEPRSVARHRVSSTIGRLNRNRVRRIEQRNRLIYHWIHLHDPWFLLAHVVWVTVLGVTAPLRLKPGFLVSLIAALKRSPLIRRRRIEEKRASNRTDREVLALFDSVIGSEGLHICDEECQNASRSQ